jgi:4-amino-4-deoxy-L-arabinose transferase-like glycosyltransferase
MERIRRLVVGRAGGLGMVALLAVLAAVPLLIPPGGEFPVDDDWAYTRAVQQMIETGSYQRSVWIDTAFVAQAWWGVLVSQVLGLSQTSLRLGTLLLAGVAVVLFYRLLCRIVRPALALAATLLLLFHPLFLHLAYTFMTDVPFLATLLAAIWCACRAVEDRAQASRLAWLAAGSALIGLACLVRQIGIVLMPAVLLGALPELRAAWAPRGRWLATLAVLAIPFGIVVGAAALAMGPRDAGVEVRFLDLLLTADPPTVLRVALHETAASALLLGLSAVPAAPLIWLRLRRGDWGWHARLLTSVLLLVLAWAFGGRAGTLELGAAPAMLALVVALPWRWIEARGRLRPWLVRAAVYALLAEVLAAAVLTSSLAGPGLSPLFGNTLSAAGLTVSGLHPHALALDALTTTLLGVLGLLGAMTLALLCGGSPTPGPSLAHGGGEPGPSCSPSPTHGGMMSGRSPATMVLRTTSKPIGAPRSGRGLGGLSLPLPLRLLVLSSLGVLAFTLGYGPIGGPPNGLYDRYLLPVLPGLLAATAYVVRERRTAVPLLLLGAIVFAGWSVPWQREYLARQAAVWTVAQDLVHQGIAADQIDAGYEWAGWTRGDAVIEGARAAALAAGEPRQFVQIVVDGLYKPHGWYVSFGPLGYGCAGQPLVTVPYGDGGVAYGLHRCRPYGGSSRAPRPPPAETPAATPQPAPTAPDPTPPAPTQPPSENDTSSL